MPTNRSEVEGTRQRALKNDRKTKGKQYLNAREVKDRLSKPRDDQEVPIYDINSYLNGQFVRPDKAKDEKYALKARLGPVTPFGVQMADEGVTDWILAKKDQELHSAELALASHLIDRTDPRSQEEVFNKFAELKSVPEQAHLNNLALQESLRKILRDGTVNGVEDNSLIFYLIRNDVEVPVYPLWDPNGFYLQELMKNLNAAELKSVFTASNTNTAKKGLFGSFMYAPEKGDTIDGKPENWWKFQREIKRMILKRLYPALRDKTPTDLDVFINRLSNYTNSTDQVGALTEQVVKEKIGDSLKNKWFPDVLSSI